MGTSGDYGDNGDFLVMPKAGWINRCCLGPEKSNLLRLKGKNAESSSSIRLHKSKDQFSKIARNPVFQPHANPLKLLLRVSLHF